MKTITFDENEWQLVPKEPTTQMLRAKCQPLILGNPENSHVQQWRHSLYTHMLAAAPQPPAPADTVAVPVETLQTILERALNLRLQSNCIGYVDFPSEVMAALARHLPQEKGQTK